MIGLHEQNSQSDGPIKDSIIVIVIVMTVSGVLRAQSMWMDVGSDQVIVLVMMVSVDIRSYN